MKHLLIVCLLIVGLVNSWGYSNQGSEWNVASLENSPEKKFLRPDRIRYDGACMTIDGKDMFVYCAAFHYFRCPEELWCDRFRDIKAAGFNTVEAYVPWNWQERSMPVGLEDNSHFDFADLRRWLQMAQDEFGLYTIVRLGPFICAEYLGGGYPCWLTRFRPSDMEELWLRSADEQHICWYKHWYDAVCKELTNEQLTRKPVGGKGIILIQIENEYNHHECYDKEKLLKALYKSVRDNGWDVLIFTCLTNECRNSKDEVLSQVFDSDNYYVGLSSASDCAYRMVELKKAQPDAPGFVAELQGGWFSLVVGALSEEYYSEARHFKAVGLRSLLGGATGLNYYMFFGGTNFAGWGARGMTTTYDYNAAISENGARGPKFFEAQAIGGFICKFEYSLVCSEGGPCRLEGAPKSLFGGIRMGIDGTSFIFLHNTDPKRPIKGTVRILPSEMKRSSQPMYSINQHGEKVLIDVDGSDENRVLALDSIEVDYELQALDSKVLVIPPDRQVNCGEWWSRKMAQLEHPFLVSVPIRIKLVKKKKDNIEKADWIHLHRLVSLPDLGVNDFRYSLYRAKVTLDTG